MSVKMLRRKRSETFSSSPLTRAKGSNGAGLKSSSCVHRTQVTLAAQTAFSGCSHPVLHLQAASRRRSLEASACGGAAALRLTLLLQQAGLPAQGVRTPVVG